MNQPRDEKILRERKDALLAFIRTLIENCKDPDLSFDLVDLESAYEKVVGETIDVEYAEDQIIHYARTDVRFSSAKVSSDVEILTKGFDAPK